VRDPIEKYEINKKTKEGDWVIVDPGVEDKRLYVQDEEFASALQCTKREGNTLSTVMRGLWDKGDAAPMTKNNKIKTTGAHVGIVTHITAAELKKLFDEVQLLNGFANRFLWVLVRRNNIIPFPKPIPEVELSVLRNQISDQIISAWKVGLVSLDPDACNEWADIYEKLSMRPSSGLVGTLLDRDAPHILRISLIYALLDGMREIKIEHLKAAMAVWKYVEQSVNYIFEGYGTDEIVNRIYEIIKKHDPKPVSSSDIFKELGGHVKKDKKDAAVNDLIATGRVRCEEVKTDGRKKKYFSLAKEANLANKVLNDSPDISDKSPNEVGSDMGVLSPVYETILPESELFKIKKTGLEVVE